MKNENRLPKYWVVMSDGSKLFKDTVLKYMNENDDTLGDWSGSKNYYFGYDGAYDCRYRDYVAYFENNCQILTIDEFISMTTPEPEFKRGDRVRVKTDMGSDYIRTFLCMTSSGRFVTEGPSGLAYSYKTCMHAPKIKEVTMSEVADKFGCEVKIVEK